MQCLKKEFNDVVRKIWSLSHLTFWFLVLYELYVSRVFVLNLNTCFYAILNIWFCVFLATGSKPRSVFNRQLG